MVRGLDHVSWVWSAYRRDCSGQGKISLQSLAVWWRGCRGDGARFFSEVHGERMRGNGSQQLKREKCL